MINEAPDNKEEMDGTAMNTSVDVNRESKDFGNTSGANASNNGDLSSDQMEAEADSCAEDKEKQRDDVEENVNCSHKGDKFDSSKKRALEDIDDDDVFEEIKKRKIVDDCLDFGDASSIWNATSGDDSAISTDGNESLVQKSETGSSSIQKGDGPGGDVGNEESEDGESPKEYILKCVMRLKRADERIVLELEWLDGQSRELLHQVKTFLQNKLKVDPNSMDK